MKAAVRSMILKSIDLIKYSECPKCGASWKELEDSLYASGEDRATAETIIANCDVCKIRFGGKE